MKIRIATWNVAGGRKMNSLEHFDYSENEEFDYFSSQLKQLDLDIVCFQESQFKSDDSFAKRVASSLGFSFVAESPGFPSHVDKEYKMSSAIISRWPLEASISYQIPYPNFRLIHNGKELPPFDRYFLKVNIDKFTIATAHPEPLGMFDLSYEEGEGTSLANSIDELIIQNLSKPLICAADLNFDNVIKVLPESVKKFNFREALTVENTTPKGGHPDHILVSDEFSVLDSGVVETETDHYLCWAEVEID